MPQGPPVSLALAVLAAVIGGALALWIVVRFALEMRQRRRLLASGPDTSELDPDLVRYLGRVWLLVAAWRDSLEAGPRADVERLWEEAQAQAAQLQRTRREGDESAEQVAALVALEERIEAQIATIGASR